MEQPFVKSVILLVRGLLDARTYLSRRFELPFSRFLSLAVWEVAGLLIVAAFAFGACLGVLYFGKSLWVVYSQTLIGQEYLKGFTETALAADEFYNRDLIRVCAEMNIVIVACSVPLALICQCTYLKALLYDPKSLIGLAVFWVLPFSALTSFLLERSFSYELHWGRLIPFTLLPSALLLNHFMEFAARIIPHGFLLNLIFSVVFRIGYFVARILLPGKKGQ